MAECILALVLGCVPEPLGTHCLSSLTHLYFCTGVGGGFTYLRGRWASMASEAITRRLRNRLFSHLERLPAAFHDRSETGDLIQRCTSDDQGEDEAEPGRRLRDAA